MQQKNGNLTAGVGGQYIPEMGKTDNCIVVVRTCFYDCVKSLPLDIAFFSFLILYSKVKKA